MKIYLHIFNEVSVLIHESTFALLLNCDESERERVTSLALSRAHSTNIMAAENAKRLRSANLILTHFVRYEINEAENGQMKIKF